MNNSGEASFDLVYSPCLTTSRISPTLNRHPRNSYMLSSSIKTWLLSETYSDNLGVSPHVKLVVDSVGDGDLPSESDSDL